MTKIDLRTAIFFLPIKRQKNPGNTFVHTYTTWKHAGNRSATIVLLYNEIHWPLHQVLKYNGNPITGTPDWDKSDSSIYCSNILGIELRRKIIQFPSSLAETYENWVGSWTYDHDALVSYLMGQGQHYQSVRRPIETLMWLEYPGKAGVVESSFQSSLVFPRKCTVGYIVWSPRQVAAERTPIDASRRDTV